MHVLIFGQGDTNDGGESGVRSEHGRKKTELREAKMELWEKNSRG